MIPLLAQVEIAAVAAKTNAPAPLITVGNNLATRFEHATGLPPEVAVWGANIIASILVLVIGYILAGMVRNFVVRLLERRHIDATVSSFAGNVLHAAVMTFVVIQALGQLGVDTKTFAAVIAAAGLAIGLALQGGLSNFAAGFLIVVFRPFRKGDVINGAGIEGTVEEVQVFSTTLNTADNKKIIVPNSALMAGNITNYTANPTRRVDLQFGVGAAFDLAKAHRALLDLAKTDARVLKNPAPSTGNVKLIGGGTLVELRAWCNTPDFGDLSSDLLAKGPAALGAAGIGGPDTTVYYVEKK